MGRKVYICSTSQDQIIKQTKLINFFYNCQDNSPWIQVNLYSNNYIWGISWLPIKPVDQQRKNRVNKFIPSTKTLSLLRFLWILLTPKNDWRSTFNRLSGPCGAKICALGFAQDKKLLKIRIPTRDKRFQNKLRICWEIKWRKHVRSPFPRETKKSNFWTFRSENLLTRHFLF